MPGTRAPRTPHREGLEVSATTYGKGCRCDGCTEAQRRYQQRMRSVNHSRSALTVKARARAVSRTVTWVREHHPDVWRRLLDEARSEFGL